MVNGGVIWFVLVNPDFLWNQKDDSLKEVLLRSFTISLPGIFNLLTFLGHREFPVHSKRYELQHLT